ncbi:MAG TPA: hypothetical protein V6C88_02215 [Chroococcidiopsis sp.]
MNNRMLQAAVITAALYVLASAPNSQTVASSAAPQHTPAQMVEAFLSLGKSKITIN